MRRKRVPREERDRVAGLVRAGASPRERRAMAAALGVCERSLREWGQKTEMERLGRPFLKRAKLRDSIRTLRAAWTAMTAGMGKYPPGPGVPSLHAKCSKVSRYLTEKFVAARKRRSARVLKRTGEEHERSVEVREPDVVMSLDGIHLGRSTHEAIRAHVLRDRGTLRFLGAWVGTDMKADVLGPRLVELLKSARPYVFQVDGDPTYMTKPFRRWLRKNRIMPYISEPRTPQHNPVAEEGMRELRMFLPTWGAFTAEEWASFVERAFLTLNREWPRPSRGGLSSEALYALPRVEKNREAMYRQFVIFKRQFRREMGRTLRARRRANRRAVEATLVAFGLATVKIGGVPLGPGVGRN